MILHRFVVSLLVLLLRNGMGASISLQSFDPIDSDGECAIFNEKYWTIIEEFYGSINLISFYFIHPNKPNASTFHLSSTLLNQLPKSTLI